jgi:hypothetical protein
MKLQNIRKPLEGECAICHEELDPFRGDIAFCQGSCGQNIHEKCIKQWTRTQKTCPMCRKPWKTDAEALITLEKDLDPDAVQLYLDWLYTGQLQISQAIDRGSHEFDLHLLKAWIVSEVIDDSVFRQAIIVEHLTVTDEGFEGFGLHAIEFAFKDDTSHYMRAFVVDSFHVYADQEHFGDLLYDYPDNFVRELCLVAMQSNQQGAKAAEEAVQKKWIK